MESFRAALRLIRDRWDPELRRRRRSHRLRNENVAAGRLAIRDGVVVQIDDRARESMEHFLFRSKEMCRELDAFLAAAAQRRCLLDVGALHGIFSLAFTCGHPERRAVAVEPSPVAREILVENASRNPACAIVVSDLALGSASGEQRMRVNWQHLEALGAGDDPLGSVAVRVESADRLCRDFDVAPDIVKIDVEGFELAVLEGARSLLAAKPLLILEIHPTLLPKFGTSATEVLEHLQRAGYRLETVGGGRLPSGRRLNRRSAIRLLGRAS